MSETPADDTVDNGTDPSCGDAARSAPAEPLIIERADQVGRVSRDNA